MRCYHHAWCGMGFAWVCRRGGGRESEGRFRKGWLPIVKARRVLQNVTVKIVREKHMMLQKTDPGNILQNHTPESQKHGVNTLFGIRSSCR